MSQLSPNLNVMIQAAEKAARSLVRDFGEVEKLQISRKGPGDFVSRADTRAEEIIHEHLESSRPGYGFLMEESEEIKSDSEYRWIVDPLDGTNNFLHGIPYWCISIALEHRGDIMAGIVYNPISDEMFRAEKGRGAFMNRHRLRVSARKDIDTCVVAFGSIAKEPIRLQNFINHNKSGMRRAAAGALDMCYVAAGRYDAFVGENGDKVWDFAAGSIIVNEAGGVVRDLNGGKDYIQKNSGIFCSNVNAQTALAEILQIKPPSKKSA